MLRKLLLTTAAIVSGSIPALAVPAYPDTIRAEQPDGTSLAILLHGDEYMHYTTTTDGYTVIRNNGFLCYAVQDASGHPVASDMVAHDAELRSQSEKKLLASLPGTLLPAMTDERRTELRSETKRRHLRRAARKAGGYDYNRFRGLVVLIEFNDRSFMRDDSHAFFDDMLNTEGYRGYTTQGDLPEVIECTGSVRDYFHDNSGGLFNPQFDVVGPIRVDRSMYDVGKYVLAREIGAEALQTVDDTVDFSRYDTDGDGIVDMIYFIYAGAGSNTGNDERLLWPHASSLAETGLQLDGVTFGSYACSTELTGKMSLGIHDGIGTICHEFSHVLGLFDVYDTDYSGSGGQSTHPAHWSVMATGSYLNNSRTPCGYSLFERQAAGFTTPEAISSDGDFELEALSDSNTGYRIDTRVENEYFLIENRQQKGWDAYLPGHGMLVFRVDFTDPDVWERNVVNSNPAHNHYELVRANPVTDRNTGAIADTSYDPFPGEAGITELGNRTVPALRAWSGLLSDISLSGISENDGIISFHAEYAPIMSVTENFESFPLTSSDMSDLQGEFCKWSLKGATVAQSGNSGQALSFHNRGEAITSLIEGDVQTMSFIIDNTSSQAAKVRLYYRKNDTGSWIALKDYNLNRDIEVEAGKKVIAHYDIEATEPTSYRFVQAAGSASEPVFIDEVSIEVNGHVATNAVKADISEVKVSVRGNIISVEGTADSPVCLYGVAGHLAGMALPENGTAEFTADTPGLYIVVCNGRSSKIIVSGTR